MRISWRFLLPLTALLIAGCSTTQETETATVAPQTKIASVNRSRDDNPAGTARANSPASPAEAVIHPPLTPDKNGKVRKSEEEWRQLLTEEQYNITRQAGTERAFTGAYWNNHEEGIYRCADCGQELFSSSTKFESGTGWPSFWEPLSSNKVTLLQDYSDGMMRTEVRCSRCDAHLGHVFDDGPQPTGQRYCMNSAALAFVPANKAK